MRRQTAVETDQEAVDMAACARAVRAYARRRDRGPFKEYNDSKGQYPAPKRVEVARAREPLPATGRPRPTTLSIIGRIHAHDHEDRVRAEELAAERARAAFFARVRAFFRELCSPFYRRRQNDDGDDETVCCSCFVLTRRVTGPQPVPC